MRLSQILTQVGDTASLSWHIYENTGMDLAMERHPLGECEYTARVGTAFMHPTARLERALAWLFYQAPQVWESDAWWVYRCPICDPSLRAREATKKTGRYPAYDSIMRRLLFSGDPLADE